MIIYSHSKSNLGLTVVITYTIGAEYGIAKNMELVAELEGADVESTRGMSILCGLKYKF